MVGGAPLNVAVHLRRGGLEVRLLSRVGRDPRGRAVRTLLEAEGVDLELLQEDEGPTGWVTVALSEHGEPSYVLHEQVSWDRIALPREVPAADILYFGSLAGRAPESRRTLAALRERPFAWRVFDVNLRQHYWSQEQVRDGVARARLVKLNHDELRQLGPALGCDEAGPGEIFDRFPGLELVCLTRGAAGAELWGRDGLRVWQPVREVPVVDTVGAGDALCAGLVGSLVAGEDPEAALAAGVERALVTVQHRGALSARE